MNTHTHTHENKHIHILSYMRAQILLINYKLHAFILP